MSSAHPRTARRALLGLLLASFAGAAHAWGEAGHRMIGLAAAQALPADMPAFFREAAPQLSWLNPEPDRWRDPIEALIDPSMGASSAAEHYLDMEKLTPPMRATLNRDTYLAAIHATGEGAAAVGTLPYAVLDGFQRLRVDFRLWRDEKDADARRWLEQRIVNEAGVLGHYVADASNPHHTTIHHDGWVGDNPKHYGTAKGFHYRFEGLYVGSHFKAEDLKAPLAALKPQALSDPRAALWAYLDRSHGDVEPLYQLDAAAPFDDQPGDEAHRAFALARLVEGAQMLRDVWYTAWIGSEVTPAQKEALRVQQEKRKAASGG